MPKQPKMEHKSVAVQLRPRGGNCFITKWPQYFMGSVMTIVKLNGLKAKFWPEFIRGEAKRLILATARGTVQGLQKSHVGGKNRAGIALHGLFIGL